VDQERAAGKKIWQESGDVGNESGEKVRTLAEDSNSLPVCEVLEIELSNVQKRVLDAATRPLLFRITEEGRAFLLQEGTDQRYGARHLKRAIERHVVYPIARLLGRHAGQLAQEALART
jgi:hypothetical protein